MTEAEWVAINILWGITLAEILDYFSMSWEWVLIMTIMLVLDFIFWLLSAKSRWEKIESRIWQHGLMKKISRWLLPFIVVAGLKRTGMWGIEELVKVVMGMIVFSELYSIIWHIYSINYWKELAEIDSFKMLLERILKLIKWKVEETLPPKDEEEWKENDNTESQEQI